MDLACFDNAPPPIDFFETTPVTLGIDGNPLRFSFVYGGSAIRLGAAIASPRLM
jgi:hypothetical protein